MEQAEKKMNGNSNDEREPLRKYLLGTLSDKEAMRKIEENLLLDDDFEERLSIAEDELLDEYLDGSLSETEQRHFLQFFLITPEREERLRFIRDLRKYAVGSNRVETDNAAARRGAEASGERKPSFNWRDLFALPAVRFAVVALFVCGLGFAVWRLVFYQSYVDKGLAQLRVAYRGQRPIEPRTTANFEYAQFSDTRSTKQTDVTDARALDRARSFLRDATENESDAEAFHAQGLVFLSEKEFDKALGEFDRALQLAPQNARLHSDIGAAYLEKASSLDRDEQKPNIDSSLEHLNRALELDENLPEALFNKALALEKIPTPEEAARAWRKYLEKDSTSDWAKEAQRRLQELESPKSQSLSAEQLEKAFLEAFRRDDAAGAGQLISRNRELITGKYLPQALAVSFVKAPGNERNEYLQALSYAAKLEEKNIGDLSAGNLAAFYAKISDANLELVKQAQALLLNSYQLCLNTKTKEALPEAEHAERLFLQAGDDYEAALSRFIIIYCLVQNEKYKESLAAAQNLADFCRQNNYRWLLSHTLYWLAAAQRVNSDPMKAKLSYEDCLNLARETRDPQILQKILISFAKRSKSVGENRVSLEYLGQAFDALASTPGLSAREKWGSYSDSIEILSSLALYNMAKAVSLENFQIAKDSQSPVRIAFSQLDNGIVNAQAEDYEEARFWLNEVRQNAETMPAGSDRTQLLAKSLLTLGYLERRLKNYSQAAKFYDEALATVENTRGRFYLYEIEKARLQTNIALNRDAAQIDEQVSRVIDLAENYRQQIQEESASNSFFSNQQDIYDIAVDNSFRRARYEEAYNYLEISNSRALLNWLKKGVSIKNEEKKIKEIEVVFEGTAQPLPLAEIRAQVPEGVQILQYAVLENKVLLWLISKDDFRHAVTKIESEKLSEKINAYTKLVSAQDDKKQEESKRLATELYDLLIKPVADRLDPARQICVIPHKALFNLPFAALTDANGNPFLRQFNFFYAPSANVFLLFTENARRKSAAAEEDESLLSVGNPRFDRSISNGEFKNLRDLPEAEVEAREIMQFYAADSKPLLGKAATETALQESLGSAEVIHFAGHYIVRDGEPLASGLLLTRDENGDDPDDDGILTNAELISRKMPQAKLVVLSACRTGVERYYNGEGLVGLSRTFLAAGAPLVVASHWQVDSGATAILMKKFHSFRRRGKLSTTEALRRAQLEMLESDDPSLRQPYYWAAFATYGGYAEF